MKKTAIITVILTMLLLTAIPALAGTDVKFDAQIRARCQFDNKSFDTTYSLNNFRELRTRLGMSATVEENAHIYIQLQDSRVFGEYNQFGQKSSGTLSDGKNVDLHQGYIKIDKIFGEGWGGQVGRFEFVKGNHRFFGNVGWHNVGRSWDGTSLWYTNENFKATGFWLKSLELQNMTYNRDIDLFGVYAELNKINLDLFVVLENNADTNGYIADIKPLNRYNLGMFYKRKYDQFDFEMNGVYQTGTMANGSPTFDEFDMVIDTVKSELDIAAFLFTFEGGYSFEGDSKARVALGVDYSSGDDGKDSTKYKAFTNSYYTGHKFRGYMDYFLGSGRSGLMDIIVRAKFDPTPGWTVKGDFHYFSTAQDYVSNLDGSTLTKDIGMEFDLTVSTTKVAGVNLVAGASVFMPKEDWVGMNDPDMGFWAYTMATVSIK